MKAALDLQELKTRVGSELTTVGSGPQVTAGVQSMANLALPLAEKYRSIDAAAILKGNTTGSTKAQVVEQMGKLVKALNVLNKYGCNLTSPSKPRYWRSVKHNNPIFKSQVDGMQGGRGILYLYGYTVQQVDGLSFPEDVNQPDKDKVALVTLEVMCLGLEVDMLIKGTHPHPEFFKDVVPLVVSKEERGEMLDSLGPVSDASWTSTMTSLPPTTTTTTTTTKAPVPTKRLQPPTTNTTTKAPVPTHRPPPPTPTKPLVSVATVTSPPTPAKRPPPIAAKPCLSPTTKILLSNPTPTPTMPPPVPTPRRVSWPPSVPEVPAPALSPPPPSSLCTLCGTVPTVTCPSCSPMLFCKQCDGLYHQNPSRAVHQRQPLQKEDCSICGVSAVEMDCSVCAKKLCLTCDELYHRHPDRTTHKRTEITKAATSRRFAEKLEEVLQRRESCETNLTRAPEKPPKPSLSHNTEWQCSSCTMMNIPGSVLCAACDRPRLASRPSVTTPTEPLPNPNQAAVTTQWTCQRCTFLNTTPSAACAVCLSPSGGGGGVNAPPPQTPALHQTPATPPTPTPNDEERQRQTVREDSLTLIKHFKAAEKRGVTPEEVCAALVSCGGSDTDPCDWLELELPHLLDEICTMATNFAKLKHDMAEGRGGHDEGAGGAVTQPSQAEARQAWLSAGGDVAKAVKRLLRDRRAKMRELHCLGFQDEEQCQVALLVSGGEIGEALTLLQVPLMKPFLWRIQNTKSEVFIDVRHPDKEQTCRRLLAFHDLPSWGRCELALSLLPEERVEYTLEDVVQVVKECQDRDLIDRILKTECLSCTGQFPRNKMQSLTSCQCVLCRECFKICFNTAVKEKHVTDLVCQFCHSMDINDPEQMLTFFSTLDIQLRDCLDPDVYDVFSKKLLEYTVMKDPNFLWCCHCSAGFIYEGRQFNVSCVHCNKHFCTKCKKPWEPQHQDLSCEMFLQWKRDNDPEWQKQGLAGYLLENGITCPSCGFQYALAKGGCMHFTCSRCKHQFCSGCNVPYHKALCKNIPCTINGLHAHHPRDCLFYLRDWEPPRLQLLLQSNGVAFNTDPPNDAGNEACSVMQQKEEAGGQLVDMACGVATEPGQAGLCEKHYREYLVSLINDNTLDPLPLFDGNELFAACKRYNVLPLQGENEEDGPYHARLLENLREVPLGDKVPRRN